MSVRTLPRQFATRVLRSAELTAHRPAIYPLALLGILFTNSAVAQSLNFAGLPHSSLGQATMSVSGGKLVVAGIGSSGQDGVEMFVGHAESHRITFETAGAASLPTGAAMSMKAIGTLSGLPNQEISTLRVEDVGLQFGASFDSSHLQPTSVVVEARLAGVVVASRTYAPPPTSSSILATFPPEGCVVAPFVAMPGESWATIGLASTGTVTITGQSGVVADQLVVISKNPAQSAAGLSKTRMLGAGIPLFQISKEAIGVFGNYHTSLGQATMSALTANEVVVAGIGGIGQDGVECALPNSSQADFQTSPISLAAAGRAIELSSKGSYNGVENTFLGGATMRNVSGSAIEVGADFSPLGATQVRLEIWKDGIPKGSVILPASSNMGTLSIAGNVIGCGKNPPSPPCIYIDFDTDVVLSPSGSPALPAGNQLRVLANNGSGVINHLSSYSIKAANIPGFSILCELEPSVAYGAGCPTVLGSTPALTVSPCVKIGTPITLATKNGIPSTLAVLLVGAAPAALPIGNCELLIAPILTSLALPLDPLGSVTVAAQIPSDPALIGIELYLQSLVLNPTALGFAASNGVRVHIN